MREYREPWELKLNPGQNLKSPSSIICPLPGRSQGLTHPVRVPIHRFAAWPLHNISILEAEGI